MPGYFVLWWLRQRSTWISNATLSLCGFTREWADAGCMAGAWVLLKSSGSRDRPRGPLRG